MFARIKCALCGVSAVALLTGPTPAQCWQEVALLVASDGAAGDYYGFAVALSGDTAAVGAYYADAPKLASGAVYVHERDAGGPGAWGEVRKVVPSDAQKSLHFGYDLDLDGNTLAVGAPTDWNATLLGAVYLFERDLGGTGNWGQMTKLQPPDVVDDDAFGRSLALSGDTLVVGAWAAPGAAPSAGAAYVFERDLGGPDSWGQVTKLSLPVTNLLLGYDVAVSGDTLALGAVGDASNGFLAGAAYVFERDLGGPGSWGLAAKRLASDGFQGDYFGSSVDLFEDTLVVGAVFADHDDDDDSGAAYVFERDHGGPGAWGEVRKLAASDGVPDDWFAGNFGGGVSISGDTIVAGAYRNDDFGTDSGSVYTFERPLGGPVGWGQTSKLLPAQGAKFEAFGVAVAADGDSLVAGASGGQVAGAQTGWARVYVAALPAALPYCTAGTSAGGCQAFLAGCGAPSASALDGYSLRAGNLEGFQDALLYFGISGRQALPWGPASYQCVRPPVHRTPLQSGAGNGAPGWCDGTYELDLNALWCPTCPKPGLNPGAGTVVQAQLWIRDPLAPLKGSTTSSAVEFTVGP